MSDLSWLNPTPHAIAVYASQPLSPVATQHSLPSGRYSFTWAGLAPARSHQLCLTHSLDHLVGTQQNGSRHIDTEHLRGLQIDDRLEFSGLFNGNFTGFLALENLVYEVGGAAKKIGKLHSVTEQPAAFGQFERPDRKQSMLNGERS